MFGITEFLKGLFGSNDPEKEIATALGEISRILDNLEKLRVKYTAAASSTITELDGIKEERRNRD